jgi:hypothetical protein
MAQGTEVGAISLQCSPPAACEAGQCAALGAAHEHCDVLHSTTQ